MNNLSFTLYILYCKISQQLLCERWKWIKLICLNLEKKPSIERIECPSELSTLHKNDNIRAVLQNVLFSIITNWKSDAIKFSIDFHIMLSLFLTYIMWSHWNKLNPNWIRWDNWMVNQMKNCTLCSHLYNKNPITIWIYSIQGCDQDCDWYAVQIEGLR